MKRITGKTIALLLTLVLLFTPMTAAFAADGFHYQHDPRLNPTAMADALPDPDAVYGFVPNPDSVRLGTYAQYDWTDAAFVAESRQTRVQYHAGMQELYDLKDELTAQGKDIETIARAVSALRNEIRLRACADDPETLAATKASNLAAYGNENGPTADSLYAQYGSWETVLSKAFSTNPGMDAVLGLYDDYYDLYVMMGMIEDTYYSEALNWAYTNGVTDPITSGVFEPQTVCTRAEAVMLLWGAAGCPVVNYFMQMKDVASDAVYAEAVRWALSEKISLGTGADTFSPDASCTRAQMLTLLARMEDRDADSGAANPFTDVDGGAYYAAAVLWAASAGIARGVTETSFCPDENCTRGAALTFLWRCVGAAA